MYDAGSCSDLTSAAPLDLKRGQLVPGRLGSAPHSIKEELAVSGAASVGVGVDWPSGCGYRLPSWGAAAAAPFEPLKAGVDRVKMPAAELGRDRTAAYFSPGLYLGREPLPAAATQREAAGSQDKRLPGEAGRGGTVGLGLRRWSH